MHMWYTERSGNQHWSKMYWTNWQSCSKKREFSKCQLYARHWSRHLTYTTSFNIHSDRFSRRNSTEHMASGTSPGHNLCFVWSNKQRIMMKMIMMMMVMTTTYRELFPDTVLSTLNALLHLSLPPSYEVGAITIPFCRWGNSHTDLSYLIKVKKKKKEEVLRLWSRTWTRFCLKIY